MFKEDELIIKWTLCGYNVTVSIMFVLLKLCTPVSLLYMQQGAEIIWPSSWPSSLRMLCGCFDDAALLSSLLQQQGGETRTQCPYPLFFHLAGTQMDTLLSALTNVQKEKGCIPRLYPAEPDSLQMFLRNLRGGNHLCLRENSWTLVQRHSLKQLSVGIWERKFKSSGRPRITSHHCITSLTDSIACETLQYRHEMIGHAIPKIVFCLT